MKHYVFHVKLPLVTKLLQPCNVIKEDPFPRGHETSVVAQKHRTMTMFAKSHVGTLVLAAGMVSPFVAPSYKAMAQAPAASPAARQIGTVKAISGSNITLAA